MVARDAPANVRICALRGVRLTRPLLAVMPAGYQSRAARAMVDVLQEVSDQWQAAARAQPAVAETRAA
jgi:hypothetical protein